mmetsp:Transcript_8227/g.10765  ORF Transcript_8227/g.10765 Transcript_8227/m.10765 type:complete len:142 (+) Transcript_8227:1-426(+)
MMKSPNSDSLLSVLLSSSGSSLEQAVQEEALALMAHDAYQYPIIGDNVNTTNKAKKQRKLVVLPPQKTKPPPHTTLSIIPDSYLEQAKGALALELAKDQDQRDDSAQLEKEKGSSSSGDSNSMSIYPTRKVGPRRSLTTRS